MGQTESGPEFHVNFGTDRVGSLHLCVGLSRIKKIGLTSNPRACDHHLNGPLCYSLYHVSVDRAATSGSSL